MTSPVVRTMPAVQVHTAGSSREALSVEITRQIPALGPGHVGVPGGLLAATATAQLTEQGDVSTSRKAAPWDRSGTFPPRRRDALTVDVGGTRRFTGVIDTVSGGNDDLLTAEAFESAINRYNRDVTYEPITNPRPEPIPGHGRPSFGPWATIVTHNLHSNTAVTRLDPNASFHLGTMFGPVTALPYVGSRRLLDLLMEIAAARGSAIWFNETGQLVWMDGDVLLAQQPTATITADADILAISWREDTRDQYRSVYVTTKQPNVDIRDRPNLTLWQGSVQVLAESGDSITTIATPQTDTDWILADAPGERVVSNSGVASGRERRELASKHGGVRYDPEDDGDFPDSSATGIHLQVDVTTITSQAVKYAHTALPGLPSNEVIATRWSSTTPSVASGLRRRPMPTLRGFGKVEWEDDRCRGAMNGASDLPDLTHVAGPWVQGSDCQTLANWIAQRVTSPSITLDELPIVYRTDLSLGQVITVHEDRVYHFSLTCLVIGIRERHTPQNGAQMWVTLRVLDADGIELPD